MCKFDQAKKAAEENGHNFNCYGFALYMAGVLDYLDWVDPDDMLDLLDRHFEKVVKVGPGDLVILKDPTDPWVIIHAAVVAGANRLHHKCGSSFLREADTLEKIKEIYPSVTRVVGYRLKQVKISAA